MEAAIHPNTKFIVGIDEAGRGPIAGPVAVGVVALPLHNSESEHVRDSKQLAQHKRERYFYDMQDQMSRGEMRFSVSMSTAGRIDDVGIVRSVSEAMRRALNRLELDPEECLVLLDGGLRAPEKFKHQKTIIRGDEKEHAIALASIAAKVQRDAKMRSLSGRYPQYGFEQHKGYGTREHYIALKQHGLCDEHRRTFLTRVLEQVSV